MDQAIFSLYYQYTGLDTLIEEAAIKLPEGYEPVEPPPPKSLRSPIADYEISFSFEQGIITVRKNLINKKAVVMPEQYLAFKKFFSDFVKFETQSTSLRKR